MMLFCVIVWRNWYNRNRLVHGLYGLSMTEVVEWSKAYASYYIEDGLAGKNNQLRR